MVAKNETIGELLIKFAHRLGVVVLTFWILEFTINIKVHLWTNFNLNHPVIMVIGFALVTFALWRFIIWVSVLKKIL